MSEHRFEPTTPSTASTAVTDGADEDGYEDGNALAGPLSEIFAVDVVSAEGPLHRLRDDRAGRAAAGVRAGTGAGGAVPAVRSGRAAVGARRRIGVAGPARDGEPAVPVDVDR